MPSFSEYYWAGRRGHLIGVGGVSMSPLAEVLAEAGLVITGHFCVDKMQRADAGQPVLDETTDESLLRRACDGVHRYGGKLFFQLSHSGIKGVESVNGAPPKHPEDFTREELDRLVE